MAGNTRRDIILIKDWGLQRERERERKRERCTGRRGRPVTAVPTARFHCAKAHRNVICLNQDSILLILVLIEAFFSSQNVLILLY